MFYNVTLNDEDLNRLSHIPAKTDSSMYRLDTLLQQVNRLNAPGINITGFKPDRITLSAESSAATLLCSSIPEHPGWKLRLDGTDAEKVVVNGGMIGCVLPAGKHTLELYYVPVKLKAGLACTAVAFVLLLIALFVYRNYRKKATA